MTPVLRLDAVTKAFGGLTATRAVSLQIAPGEIVGLVGPNGAGKTTLVNMITGYMRPDEGTIAFRDRDVTTLQPHAIAQLGMARTYQNLRLFDELSVLENVLIGRHRWFEAPPWRLLGVRRREEREQRVASLSLLAELGMADLANATVHSLPYGTQRRVEIARALAIQPTVLVLDEPTAGMSEEEAMRIADLISQTAAAGVAVVLVEHNVGLVKEVVARAAVLNFGELIAIGPPDEVFEAAAVQQAYFGTEGHLE